MNEVPTNPFASPAAVSAKEFREFHVWDREVVSREQYQAVFAGGLVLVFAAMWINLIVQAGFFNSDVLIGHGVLAFMTFSCVATVVNHTVRARHAWQRFPLQLNDEGIRAKFEDGDKWTGLYFAWDEVAKVTFAPRNRMVVTTINGKEFVADLSLMGSRKWHPLKETLKFYSDDMAKTDE
ncbi:hypothetical protein C5Y96_16770 [Blastopirellula marina]|uniref:YcxB-like protein domain-containing protein n=1 Tax=Blastopirellula marina TaxID=124 RepID=A0A2S8F7A5_9BACT|nr:MULTISPECIES: hypothetical protein [Pirellulaceae]PQO28028.1 hypothetical protein C5Y96_16770 [Blastopirellula marina]RCS48453.1 hypothetical protein DTL36_16790 [Bremerella cremea]